MPAVIGPGGIGDANLADHLACEMECREVPQSRSTSSSANSPAWSTSLRSSPKACLSPPALEPKGKSVTKALQARFEQEIAAAADLAALESVRVAALGKSGEITQLLKSLG